MSIKSLNHNKAFMFGIMAMGMVVIGVTIIFWMWCFPDGSKNIAQRNAYSVELKDGFVGDSVRVYMNDSVLFAGAVTTNGLAWTAPHEGMQNVVAVEDMVSGESRQFNVSVEKGRLLLHKKNETVTLQEIPYK